MTMRLLLAAAMIFTAAAIVSPAAAETPRQICDNAGGAFSIDQRIDNCTALIQASPTDAAAYNGRGNAYEDKRDYDQAIADYTQAIRLDPKYAAAYNNRGYAYQDKGNYDQAIADYTQAISLEPKYAQAYNNGGTVYERKKDYARAITDFTQAIALDPKLAQAFNNRCYDSAIIGPLHPPRAHCNQSLALRPNDANTLDSRGFVYLKLGQFDNAIADYDTALRINP